MDITRRQAVKSAAFAIGAAAAVPAAARAQDAAGASSQDAVMRTRISNTSPLLLSAVYGNTPDSLWWGNTLEGGLVRCPRRHQALRRPRIASR